MKTLWVRSHPLLRSVGNLECQHHHQTHRRTLHERSTSASHSLEPIARHEMTHIQHLFALPAIGHELTVRYRNTVVQTGNVGREQLRPTIQPVMTNKHRRCVMGVGDEVFDADRIIRMPVSGPIANDWNVPDSFHHLIRIS